MEYFVLILACFHLIVVTVVSIKIFNDKTLALHRRSYLFFVLLTVPVFGWLIYKPNHKLYKI